MSAQLTHRFLSFWWLQTIGWIAYAVAVGLAMSPYMRMRDELIYRGIFTVACFACSFPLHSFCRRLWRKHTPWPQAMGLSIAFSCLLGYTIACLAVWAEARYGHVPPEPFQWTHALGGGVNGSFVLTAWSAFYFGVKHYLASEAEQARIREVEALARDAVLRALRYQIHPHFLFNTLNAISTLVVEHETQAATRMIARLADFLRATLEFSDNGSHFVPLAQELLLTEQYLEIEKARLGDRLVLEQQVAPGVLHARVPHLLLQPLVENAIRHGIAPQVQGGRVIIDIRKSGDYLQLSVKDNGAGRQHHTTQVAGTRPGIGIENTTARLRQLYGDDQRLELRFPPEGGCIVEVEIPFAVAEQTEVLAPATIGAARA